MNNIKRAVAFIIICVLCLMSFGCSNISKNDKDADNSTNLQQVSPSELTAYLLENIVFEDLMNEMEEDIALSLFNIDKSFVEELSMYASTGATAEEIAVIKATKGNVDEVKKSCEARIEVQKESFKNYVPKELEKLEKPYIYKEGDVVVFVVSNDAENTKKLLEEYGNKEV